MKSLITRMIHQSEELIRTLLQIDDLPTAPQIAEVAFLIHRHQLPRIHQPRMETLPHPRICISSNQVG
jgi:hypothetical protein